MKEKLAIGIDLGCTNIKGVLVNGEGLVIAELKADTREHDHNHWKNAVAEMIKALRHNATDAISAIGLSAPGLADNVNQCITVMPGRLLGLENFNWSNWIGEKVLVLNDAHAALMAEAAFGAAKGLQHAVLCPSAPALEEGTY